MTQITISSISAETAALAKHRIRMASTFHTGLDYTGEAVAARPDAVRRHGNASGEGG